MTDETIHATGLDIVVIRGMIAVRETTAAGAMTRAIDLDGVVINLSIQIASRSAAIVVSETKTSRRL